MKLILISLIFLFVSCSNSLNDSGFLDIDLKPPVLQNILIENSTSLTLNFDEAVYFEKDDYKSDPQLNLQSWTIEENTLIFNFNENQEPGRMYKCRSDVKDESGNILSFIIRYYGWNPQIPPLLINEFNPEGSGNNPDSIELYVSGDGNTAGVTLFLGTADFFSEKYVLPSLDVQQGDYIIVHMRPEGLSGEITETDDKAVSTGKLASDMAWDLWVEGDKPVSGKNGIISLYTNPFGTVIDAVPYSNRVTGDSEDYRGWTSSTFNMIEDLSFLNVWKSTDGFIRPEDAFYSEGTTGTRSICRNSSSDDSDVRDDWHIVPTSEKSFGQVNSDNIYLP
jgi:hypothetical protein